MKSAYQFQWMPKLILSGSFDFGFDEFFKGATIVDDPDVLNKTAGSKVVHEWGDIQPRKGHSMIHLIALGADEVTGQNANGDGFKEAFLKKAHSTFKTHGALFKNHVNKDFSKRYGDVEKTAYNDEMGRVELLVSANQEKCGGWLSDLERGKRVDFSMGFDCHHEVCKTCGHISKTRAERCDCVKKGAKPPYGMGRILPDGRKCGVDNPEGLFNDISEVPRGADAIAQHLRKAAGLDESEVISGAELFENMLAGDPVDQSVKMAAAHKCSRMEKQVPAIGFRPNKRTERINSKLASKLREAHPSDMFGELAKAGCLLDFREFFKLAMGDQFDSVASHVDEGEAYAHRCLSSIAEDPERLERVCANETYRCSKQANVLNDFDRSLLASEFSIDPEIAMPRLVGQALYGDRIDLQESLGKQASLPVQFLLDEYAAYKLAALEASGLVLDDDVIRAAVMTS